MTEQSSIQQGKTSNTPKGIPVKVKAEPELYFHTGSGTLFLVEAKDNILFEREQNLLSQLMQNQLAAKENLENLTEQCLVLAKTNPRAAEMQLKPAYKQVNDATANLREALKDLTPAIHDGQLLSEKSKESAIELMELIPMSKRGAAGFKMTYVRSDKIASHFRRYELSKVDNENAKDSFLKKVVTTTAPDAQGKTYKKTTYKIDSKTLLKQMKSIEPEIKTSIAGTDLIKNADFILSDWAKEYNKTLEHKFDDFNQIHKDSKGVDLSAQAQLMRFSRGLSADADYNPLDKQLNAKIKGHANFALGEAKVEFKRHLPDKVGINMCYPNRQGKEETLGHIKAVITITAAGSVGASLGVEAGVTIDWGEKTAEGYGIKGANTQLSLKALPGKNKGNLTMDIPDAQVGGELGAFVGLEAGANIAASLEWKSPEENQEFRIFAKLEPGLTLQAGGGASGKFYITFVKGKFRIFCKAGLCWGVGAKGKIGFEVDGGLLMEFMPMFTHMLRNMDYIKMLDVIAPDAFQTLCMLPIIALSTGVQLAEIIVDEFIDTMESLKESLKQANNRKRLMQSINNNPDCLKFTPPETKGAVIAILIDISLWDLVDLENQNTDLLSLNAYKWGLMKQRKQAIFNALKWVQSRADYENVMQHLTAVRREEENMPWQANQQRVIEFLSFSEYSWMGNLSTQYGKKLKELYIDLPEGKDIDPTLPLRSISTRQMAEYLAFVDTSSRNTQLA